jgi:hypothetical protein
MQQAKFLEDTSNLLIFDDFLSEEELGHFDFMKSRFFPWGFSEHSDMDGDNNPQFVHIFCQNTGNFFHTQEFEMLHPLIQRMQVSSIISIKANLTTRANVDNRHGLWHVDREMSALPPHYGDVVHTAVFYLNTNNGGTELEDGTFVESVRNRCIVFPSKFQHRAVRHTIGDYQRIVVNINYIPFIGPINGTQSQT